MIIKTRNYIIILILGFIGLILGILFDKDISKALYVDLNLKQTGIIISNYLLILFFIIVNSVALIGIISVINKDNKIKIPFIIIYIILIGLITYQEFDKLNELKLYYGNTISIINAIICIIITFIISIFIAKYIIKNYDKDILFKLSIVIAITILLSLGINSVIKYIASRPRPWYIFGDEYTESHIEEYKRFYEFRFLYVFKVTEAKKYFKSFPSGHTNTISLLVTSILYFLLISKKLNDDKKRTIILFVGLFISLLMAFLRICAGAHFLSDVSFAIILAYTIIYFSGIIFNKLNNKYEYLNFN